MQSLPNNIALKEDEDLSPFIRGKVKIIQKKTGYRFNVDSLLIATFANISPSKKVIDIGTGSGIIPILLNLKVKNLKLYAVEIQPEMVDIARRNFLINNTDVEIKTCDVKQIRRFFESGSFDTVITNPPYFKHPAGSIERSEVVATFDDFVSAASFLLKNKGRFFYIYPVIRFVESLLTCKKHKLQPKRIRFIHPSATEKATHVMVECMKNGKEGGEVIEKPLVMYKNPKNKEYTDEVWCLLENFPLC